MSYGAAESIHADGYDLGCDDTLRDVAGEIGITFPTGKKLYVEDLIAAMRAAIPGFAEWMDDAPLAGVETYSCLICGTTTPFPHVCPAFRRKDTP